MTAPISIAIDANGYCWRVFEDGTWSMCPTNPDNSPIPTPVVFYDRRDNDAWARAVSAAAALGAALAEFDNARDALAATPPAEGESWGSMDRLTGGTAPPAEKLPLDEIKRRRGDTGNLPAEKEGT